MKEGVLWATGAVLVLAAADRFLLWCESRSWINYRRKGFSRGAALYHIFELHSIFDPGMENTMEVRYEERQEEDDSGAPPGPGATEQQSDEELRRSP